MRGLIVEARLSPLARILGYSLKVQRVSQTLGYPQPPDETAWQTYKGLRVRTNQSVSVQPSGGLFGNLAPVDLVIRNGDVYARTGEDIRHFRHVHPGEILRQGLFTIQRLVAPSHKKRRNENVNFFQSTKPPLPPILPGKPHIYNMSPTKLSLQKTSSNYDTPPALKNEETEPPNTSKRITRLDDERVSKRHRPLRRATTAVVPVMQFDTSPSQILDEPAYINTVGKTVTGRDIINSILQKKGTVIKNNRVSLHALAHSISHGCGQMQPVNEQQSLLPAHAVTRPDLSRLAALGMHYLQTAGILKPISYNRNSRSWETEPIIPTIAGATDLSIWGRGESAVIRRMAWWNSLTQTQQDRLRTCADRGKSLTPEDGVIGDSSHEIERRLALEL